MSITPEDFSRIAKLADVTQQQEALAELLRPEHTLEAYVAMLLATVSNMTLPRWSCMREEIKVQLLEDVRVNHELWKQFELAEVKFRLKISQAASDSPAVIKEIENEMASKAQLLTLSHYAASLQMRLNNQPVKPWLSFKYFQCVAIENKVKQFFKDWQKEEVEIGVEREMIEVKILMD